MRPLCQGTENRPRRQWITELGYWIDYSRRSFTRNNYMSVTQAGAYIQSLGGVGIFQCAYYYDNPNIEEADLYGDFYLDFDAEDDFDLARQDAITALSFFKTVFRLKEDDVKIYFSGKKGVHIIVPAKLLGVEPDKRLNLIYKEIATHIQTFTKQKTLDLVIYDNKRLLRVPGTIHEKTGLYKTRITPQELRHASVEELKEIAKTYRRYPGPQPEALLNGFANMQYKRYIEKMEATQKELSKKNSQRSQGTLNYMPPCVQHLLENGAQRGGRNNTVAALVSYFRATGLSHDETVEVLLEWNTSKNKQPLSTFEMKRTIKSVYMGNRIYGCSRLKELSICNESACKLKRNTK